MDAVQPRQFGRRRESARSLCDLRDSAAGPAGVIGGASGAMSEPSDATLVGEALAGEVGAFSRLYERHFERVYRLVIYHVRDQQVAEDLVHDVFLKAYHGLPTLRERDRFGGWLARIAHNRVRNHWRALTSRPDEVELAPDEKSLGNLGGDARALSDQDSSDLQAVEDRVLAEAALSAVEQLTRLQREVIGLRFVSGLTLAETADVMGRSVGAVKNLQHEAIAALRREITRNRSSRESASTDSDGSLSHRSEESTS